MKFEVEIREEKDKIYVDVEMEHVHGTRNKKALFQTTDLMDYLESKNYINLILLKETTLFNYHTEKRCKGTWIFLKPSKKIDIIVEKPIKLEDIVIHTEIEEPESEDKPRRRRKKNEVEE